MFNKDFLWSVASAAFQIEGGVNEDGKGRSIWDEFSHEKGKIAEGQNADIACDHYHLYEKDIALMAELGVKAYRFSISWTRLLPDGIGTLNQNGIDFYNGIIDCLSEHNIIPMITLFHWDYPLALEKKDGWLNADSPKWFAEYAEAAGRAFGDRVKYFITLNEPQCFITDGYITGAHAPGKKLADSDIVPMCHNVLLAHGLAVKALRKAVKDAVIGVAPTSGASIPYTDSDEDIKAARKQYFDIPSNYFPWSVSWWSDPMLLGHYPEDDINFKKLKKYLPKDYKKDMEIINQPLDFYAQNIYNGSLWKSDGKGGYEWVANPISTAKTAMDWPVTPKALYWGPKFLYERYKLPIFISENGMADLDSVSLDGKIHDPARIDFLHRYLREYKKAAAEGIPLIGYALWSFTDNFEWAKGYSKRFGIIYTDYETLERTPKDSFYWYQKTIKENGEKLYFKSRLEGRLFYLIYNFTYCIMK